MISAVSFTNASKDILIVMEDGSEHWTNAENFPDTAVTRAFAQWRDEGGVIAPFVPETPPVLTRLAKAELWRRATDEEAEAMDAALAEAPLRLRRLFEAASYLDTSDADYPALRAGIVAAIGETRADEILAPAE